jgi:hypothetical protein
MTQTTFSRFLATVTVAAVAVAGPTVLGGSAASAAEPSAGTVLSGSTVSGPINCNPAELQAKANMHAQKAADYQILLNNELLKENPSKKKVAHYDKMVKAHQQKADEYRAKVKRCEDTDNHRQR